MDSKQNVDIFSMEVRSYRAAACLYTAKENMVACSHARGHEPVCFANNTATLLRACLSVAVLFPTNKRGSLTFLDRAVEGMSQLDALLWVADANQLLPS
jgi:hypothetical protein